MKIHFKRVATAALAVAMSLSLAVPAFAEETNLATGSLTVNGPELKGKTVTVVRMFTSHVTQKTTEGEQPETTLIYDSYELEDAWRNFFTVEPTTDNGNSTIGLTALKSLDGYNELTAEDTEAVKQAAVDYVAGLMTSEDETNVVTFATKARAWAFENKGTLTDLTETKTAAGDLDSNEGSVTFESLTSGYYLVYLEGGSYSNDPIPGAEAATGIIPTRGTDAMMINVPNAKTEWNIKSEYPTVDKKVDTDGVGGNAPADEGSAQIGKEVEFTLTSHTPNMDDYETYYFQFVDKLTGLTYTEDSVSVTVGGKTFSDFTVTKPTVENSNTLTIGLNNLKTFVADNNLADGAEIVVKYKATVNETALVEDKANNKVEVQYGNDSNELDTSTPDEVDVYNYNIDVHKYAENNEQGHLEGAEFKLTMDEAGENVVKLVPTDEGDVHNAYRVAKPAGTGTYEVGAVDSFTTTSTSDINIAGLKAGTYYLHEVNAPASYNKLKKPVKIEITLEGGDYTKPVYKVTINGKTTTGTQGDSTINVENKKGIELPETGGIGTIGLTALGVVVVVAGLFVFPRKKKNKQD